MKQIVNTKNDFIDSMYFFMMDYLIYMVCKDNYFNEILICYILLFL